MASINVRVRIDLGPGVAVGPGKISLLVALDKSGSLSKAARELNMSYRRAWLLLKSLNELYDAPLATSTKGGSGGGGASLTQTGHAVIAAFQAVEAAAQAAALKHFQGFNSHISHEDTSAVRRLPIKSKNRMRK